MLTVIELFCDKYTSNILCESLQVSVRAPLPSGSEYSLELDLSHPIAPEQSSFRVVPSKVRLTDFSIYPQLYFSHDDDEIDKVIYYFLA